MVSTVNPQDPDAASWGSEPRQTLEYRVSDGSANIHQLLAGLAMAVLRGHRDSEALASVAKRRVEENVFENEALMRTLEKLPASCEESAGELLRLRKYFEDDGVFPPEMIDRIASGLSAYQDREVLLKAREDEDLARRLVEEHFHIG